MHRRTAFAVVALVLASLNTLDASPRRRTVRTPSSWTLPCTQVEGFPAVAVSTDAGASLLPHVDPQEPGLQIHTFGLASAGSAEKLIAVTGRIPITSNDGGCSWTFDGRIQFPDHGYRLAPAGTLGTFAWTIYRPELFFIGDEIVQRAAPMQLPINIDVDANAPQQLAAADDQGVIWWSDDAAATWQVHAQAPARAPLYALEFSPRGRKHAIAAGLADGTHVTFDGGATWTRSTGVEGLNVFTIAFSPVQPDVVWAVAANPKVEGTERRGIYHSRDGGLSFHKILTASAEIPMKNGFTIAPSPANAYRLYFALPGTTLYVIDDEGTLLQRTDVPGLRDFDSIVFSPANPRVMYFGLKISDMTAE
ncbi:MAG TPA: hypothetical protein VF787_13610 [Thermoanaerobaculia bacterium]